MSDEIIHLTAGRDYNRYGAYEFCAMSSATDSRGFPAWSHRETGFKSKAAAKRAGLAWIDSYFAKREG